MSATKKGYLVVYNLISLALWSNILLTTIYKTAVSPSNSYHDVYLAVNDQLLVVQTGAVLEIVHALFGLTSTPLLTVTIQVCSRLLVLWGYTHWCIHSNSHFSVVILLLSWSSIEVVRYPLYVLHTLALPVPYVLFYLRYTLFFVLYPSGISAECYQVYLALPHLSPPLSRLSQLLLLLYLPLGPFMIVSMVHTRTRAFSKRDAKPKKPAIVQGLVWPVTDSLSSERSSTTTNKEIWARTDPENAERIRRNGNWRFQYVRFVELNHKLCLSSPTAALTVAKQGLEAVRDLFVFVRDGKEYKPSEAMRQFTGSFETGFVKGSQSKRGGGFTIPYKEKDFFGDDAKRLVDSWASHGTIEASTASSLKTVLDNPAWSDLSDQYFVLLGATSAMGPVYNLLNQGANIIAIDLDRPTIWETLVTAARNSPGTLTFPLRKPQQSCTSDTDLFENAGANLLTKTPEIANWVRSLYPKERFTVGNYTYLDGALHVQLSIAADLIISAVLETRTANLAFLCTPTDFHCIPKAAHEAALENYRSAPMWQKALERVFHAVGFTQQLVKNAVAPVGHLHYVDGMVVHQGPNYALAKRIQHWRCVVAHQAGCVVSSNIAPSTATKSVLSNPQFAAAYEGLFLFKAMEVFFQETSSAVMLALLINDIRNEKSVSHVKAFREEFNLENPFQLFEVNAFHGGVWRCAYKFRSIAAVSVVYFYLTRYKLFVVLGVALLYSTISYVVRGEMV